MLPALPVAALLAALLLSVCAQKTAETAAKGCATTAPATTAAATTEKMTTTRQTTAAKPATTRQAATARSVANIYKNTQYGFIFSLPPSWKGYSVVTGKWQGTGLLPSTNGKIAATGPLLYIRHPLWTSAKPRQDIPIMVFTLPQWASLRKEEFSVGAAPIHPSELGRNSRYVFALPARYNYAFLPGYEEVADILSGHPLKPYPFK